MNDKPNHLTDAIIDTDNGKSEITAGFFVAENEEGVEQVYALFIADGEAKRQNPEIINGKENAKYINSFTEIFGFPDRYSYVINMSDINKGSEGENHAAILCPGIDERLELEKDKRDNNCVWVEIVKEKL